MAGIIGAKKMMVSLMMLAMVVLAQGRAELAAPGNQTGLCAKKCGLKCVFRIFPSRIALCFGLCMIGCKLHPSEVVFNCTSDCANSMVNAYNPTDVEKVDSFVDSCYETCKQNNKN